MTADLLAQCAWPALGEPYDRALRATVQRILERFEPIGIVACGSIVRGEADPASDFDVWVIHREPWKQRLQILVEGVPVELFVNTLASVREYLPEQAKAGRPVTAHALAKGFVVLAIDPEVRALQVEAAAILAAPMPTTDEELTAARYHAAALFEDAVDVAMRDPAAASALLGRAVYSMIHARFREDALAVPRDKDLIAASAVLDRELGALAQAFYLAATTRERLELAGQIADRTVGARGFFEWESSRLPA